MAIFQSRKTTILGALALPLLSIGLSLLLSVIFHMPIFLFGLFLPFAFGGFGRAGKRNGW